MKNLFSRFFSLLCLFILIISSSCQSQKKDVIKELLSEPQQHFSAGEFQKAIDGYHAAYEKNPDEPPVLESYLWTLERIKNSADKAYAAKNYTLSEQIYLLLTKNFSRFNTFEKSLSFDPKFLSLRIKYGRIARSEIQARSALSAGDYAKAIEAYKALLQTYPDDQTLRENLIKTATEIHQNGIKAQQGENYVKAGKAYAVLLNNYRFFSRFSPSLPFSDKSLGEGLKQCRMHLTRKGLELYRKGKLKEAISIWEGILQFDPENVEIKKAIDNATVQLKKIKKKKRQQPK